MSKITYSVALAAVGQSVLLPATAAAQAAAETGGVDAVLVLGLLGIVITLLALAAAGLARWWRARQSAYVEDAPPLITIPSSPGLRPLSPSVPWREEPRQPPPQRAPSPPASPVVAQSQARPHGVASHPGNGSSDGDLVEGNTIRFYRPPDGTLQLLPGRLEIVAGEDIPHDIRFLRARGEDAEVTFGRSDGPPHRHVQLHARTVSRQHARMRFADRRWQIENLSDTNPVVINGRELDSADGGYVLKEGDRIEMGEVVFLFRER